MKVLETLAVNGGRKERPMHQRPPLDDLLFYGAAVVLILFILVFGRMNMGVVGSWLAL